MSDCNECINKAKCDWECVLPEHDQMWDDLVKKFPNHVAEDCPDAYPRDDAREQAGCDKLHALE